MHTSTALFVVPADASAVQRLLCAEDARERARHRRSPGARGFERGHFDGARPYKSGDAAWWGLAGGSPSPRPLAPRAPRIRASRSTPTPRSSIYAALHALNRFERSCGAARRRGGARRRQRAAAARGAGAATTTCEVLMDALRAAQPSRRRRRRRRRGRRCRPRRCEGGAGRGMRARSPSRRERPRRRVRARERMRRRRRPLDA